MGCIFWEIICKTSSFLFKHDFGRHFSRTQWPNKLSSYKRSNTIRKAIKYVKNQKIKWWKTVDGLFNKCIKRSKSISTCDFRWWKMWIILFSCLLYLRFYQFRHKVKKIDIQSYQSEKSLGLWIMEPRLEW